MKKAVIFDLDGTLADSLESIAYCTNRAIGRYGFAPFETERFKYFVGDGAAELIRRALKAAGDEELAYYDRVKAEYDVIFEADCMYKVVPYDGIPELLQTLRKKGVKTAVLSNKPHERTVDVISRLFGSPAAGDGTSDGAMSDGIMFDAVQGQMEGIARKPSPDGVYYIAGQLSVSVEEIVYVGDTDTDMQTGKSAGAFTVGVLWGFRDRKELEENHADAIIAAPHELMNYI